MSNILKIELFLSIASFLSSQKNIFLSLIFFYNIFAWSEPRNRKTSSLLCQCPGAFDHFLKKLHLMEKNIRTTVF